jgi:transposase
VTLQIVRDWVVKFNSDGPQGLIDRKSPGQPSRLDDTHRAALSAILESGPIPAIHGVVRWRIVDLCQWMFEEFRVTIAKQTLSRELRSMGYRKLSARPRHHAQAEGAIEHFKKNSSRAWTKSGARRASTRPHAALGQTRHTPQRANRSAHRLNLYLWRDLPEGRQGRRACPAAVRHRDNEFAPC